MAEPTTETPGAAEQNSPLSEPAPGDQNSTSDNSSPNREAAKYRTRLREAESKLEVSEARITALLRKEIEAHAGKSLAVGADLFTLGEVAVTDLLDSEGNPDTETIDAAVEVLLKTRPGLGNPNRPWGDVGGGHREVAERAPTMHDALRYKGR
ncbi:hypothetical protein PYK79_37065 [Streptomyces sp. ID05-04B]|uniref:hypothetical protein n=1 Tax=Streptomyces sp. ID05-04B TaxID=3028661 RepID=UPI0029C20130|nr:hypothetical protein [Streptomyces sp. ID05-04B]MDX5567763.1 hypothetical protein [Streptomyces sp. ID05-04B]